MARYGAKRSQACAKGWAKSLFVERNDGRDALGLGRNERTRKLTFRILRVSGDQDQHAVQVGSKGFGTYFVLAVKKVAAILQFFDAALVTCDLPQHLVAHHHLVFLTPRVANQASTFGRLNQAVAAIGSDHQAWLQIVGLGQGRARFGFIHAASCR
jgi:hypothetical protein